MLFEPTSIQDVHYVRWSPHVDERGLFARVWCEREFSEAQAASKVVQVNIASNKLRGTLRGIHFQKAPHEETKVFRCLRGELFAVAVDLRPHSKTFGKCETAILTGGGDVQLYVGVGIGLGYQTLCDGVEVLYLMGNCYQPSAAAGIRYDDQQLAIPWPLAPSILSAADKTWPRLREAFPHSGEVAT